MVKVSKVYMHSSIYFFVYQTGDGLHWRQIETIELVNSGSGLGFGIIGGKATGVIVKTILPGGAADLVSIFFLILYVSGLSRKKQRELLKALAHLAAWAI